MSKKGKTNELFTKPTIFIGSLDNELDETLKNYVERKQGKKNINVVLLDKNMFFQLGTSWLKQQSMISDDKEMFDYISQPEKLADAFQQAESFMRYAQENKDEYVTLKDIVDRTNLEHKGAKYIIDILWSFGFLASRPRQDGKKGEEYKVLLTDEARQNFVSLCKKQLSERYEKTMKQYDEISEWIADRGSVDVVKSEEVAEKQN